jgi:pyruvate kinase
MKKLNRVFRNAKIVCTIGPSSSSDDVISSLIKNGMDVARLNFSHGDHESHSKMIDIIRDLSHRLNKPVAILQDLQGIKIRLGDVKEGMVEIKRGDIISVKSGDGISNNKEIFILYPTLLKDVKKGDKILIDDGLIQLTIIDEFKDYLKAKVIEGGMLSNRKGVNLPGVDVSIDSFTEKDKNDLTLGITKDVDYVAISFVRNAEDVIKVKDFIRKRKRDIPVIAKIEKPEAIKNIKDIISVSDGIMIARGDLGVEMPSEEVPLIQKSLIEKANEMGKIVITATQMLESMTEHLRPTRAETTDVANAVLDGTDALMLSAETAKGKYPVEALKMMDRIIRHTERMRKPSSSYIYTHIFAEATAGAACKAAEDIRARLLVAFTKSGFTARLLSKLRPSVPVVAYTPNLRIQNRLCLYWGIVPKIMSLPNTTDEMIEEIEVSLLKEGIVKKGDNIVITSSSPLSRQGKTNFMKLHKIGE